MITFYGTGPAFGLPHASPFAIKTEILLKMAGVDYRSERADIRNAPRGKLPWIEDEGRIVTDSRMIRRHLEVAHGADFSGGYDAERLGIGLAVERLCEDHLYWINVDNRWLRPENFAKGPAQFFQRLPAALRPLIRARVLSRLRSALYGQGTGRLEPEEKRHLVELAVNALADIMGDNSYMLGPRLSGTDATVYGFLASLESDFFDTPYGEMVRARPGLRTYLTRMKTEFFPDPKPQV